MMTLTRNYHPLSSYCHKVLIALDVLGIEVDKRLLNLGDPAERAAHLALWPTGKMPLLVDQGRPVPETSIIIEHLQRHYAHLGRTLIPLDLDAALDVRLWDRLFDLYVMTPMQALTDDLLRPEGDRDAHGVAHAGTPVVGLRAHRRSPSRAKLGKRRCVQHGRLRRSAFLVLCRDLRAAGAAACEPGGLLRALAGSSLGGAHHRSGAALVQVLSGRAGMSRRFFDTPSI